MSSVDRFNPRELLRFRYDLDIPAFVQTAVQHNLNKEEVLLYLHIITNTLDGTEKMWRFVPVAKREDLTRNEILVWLHLSYGGLLDPTHLSRKLRIPPGFAENVLAALEEKGILREGRVL
ncbi:MAG: hypothetical protein OXU27_05985 [Candidatus Poribacteria bacterium]|nr:hypothetical protein [Candidatus Poribacteria bacterium]